MPPLDLLIALVLGGVFAGFASGMFGVGGGILIVPLIVAATGADFRLAVAASLLTITLSSPIGLFTHHRAGNVQWQTGAWIVAGGVAGVLLAHIADPWIPERVLVYAFAGALVWTARRMAYGTFAYLGAGGPASWLGVGILAGAVAKLLGVGGGIVVVPALALTGFTLHQAVATSLVAVFGNAAAGTVANATRLQSTQWLEWGVLVAVGSIVGTRLGSLRAIRTRAQDLQKIFAVVLVLVALAMLARTG